MTLVLLLLACKNPVTLAPDQDVCPSDDEAEAAESEVLSEVAADGTARVWRTGVELDQTGLVFDPVIEVEPKVVHVYEAWSGGGSDDPFCYEPFVTVEGVETDLQVRWYLEVGDTVPFDTVELEAP